MPNVWMVRAGEKGFLYDDFREKEQVALGWSDLGDLGEINSLDELRSLYHQTYPNEKKGRVALSVATIHKFISTIQDGDRVVTYDPASRIYAIGTIQGGYTFDPSGHEDYPHIRQVTWNAEVSRDLLPVAARNSLGSTLALFQINDDVWGELSNATSRLPHQPTEPSNTDEEESEFEQTKDDIVAQSHELIKDRILTLSPNELEDLGTSLLRAMGYKARRSPVGADRGVDIFASPDGLGLESPRIKVEVKHRPSTKMGSQDLRSFIGGLRADDRGIYISSGGFTKEARYEAERSNNPVALIDLDELASLVTQHYECFDLEGRTLLPLARVYWPSN